MKKSMIFTGLLLLAAITACDSKKSPQKTPEAPNLQSLSVTRLNAAQTEVAIYLPGQAIRYVPGPTQNLQTLSSPSDAAVNVLKNFIVAQSQSLNLDGQTPLKLRVLGVQKRGSRTSVRFEQYIERNFLSKNYVIPMEACNVVALLENGRLLSLNSTLENPPLVTFVFERPGFTVDFSLREYDVFLRHLLNSKNKDKVQAYISSLATAVGMSFDWEEFYKWPKSEQRDALSKLLGGLKKQSTFEILIDLARAGRLSLIKHNTEWLFQVTQLFDLPLQFDINYPSNTEERFKMRNLRELYQHITININSLPKYPAGKKELRVSGDANHPPKPAPQAQSSDLETMQLFQNITRYYRQNHQWIGYDGASENTVIEVNKDITSFEWSENAFWSNADRHFGIGSGGSQLSNLHKSVSTLAHEYTHAILQHSSGLIYQGQAGGINEHFADVQGVALEAYFANKDYDYTIAEDILSTDLINPKKEEIDARLKELGTSAEDITKFSLDVVALRNLYEPSLSLLQQQSHMDEVNERFKPDCEPSVDNDNCGVHSISGVMNKATSQIIARLGLAKTRSLFFNTVTTRLGSKAGFDEYLRQLYEECLITPAVDKVSECPVIIESFEKVGVKYPSAPAAS